MKNALLLSLLFSCLFSTAQTKMIAYKSHSGNLANFNTSIIEDFGSTNFSNLGAAPEIYVTEARLDSVIILDEHKSVLVTSNICHLRRKNISEKWKPGKDTVYNHSLFSSRNVDSVKSVLKNQYHFKNDIDSVVFLQYNQKKQKYEPLQKTFQKKPIQSPKKEKKSKENQMLLTVLLATGISGLYTWKRNRNKNEK